VRPVAGRRLRRVVLAAAIAATVIPLAARPAWACSCSPSTPHERAQRADAVFTGTVTSIRDSLRDRIVNFDVDTVYKGERSASIDVHTGFGGGDCGVSFVVDRRYTVFGFRGDGVLNTYSCDAPIQGNVAPGALGLGPGVAGLHRPVSVWLVAFTAVAVALAVLAVAAVARRRRRSPAS
jgi:hypothetical protein